MTLNKTPDEEDEEQGRIPARAGYTGRSAQARGPARSRTVKAKRSRGSVRPGRNLSKNRNPRKAPGKNVNAGVTEAARILREEGYIVGRVTDPEIPFHLIAHRGRENLAVTVVRPREPVMNASDVRYYYSREVLRLQPYWNSDADNIQFWIISRVAGLLRYQVFRGGIWNIETMQDGWQEKRAARADAETTGGKTAVQKSRTAPLPIRATGHG